MLLYFDSYAILAMLSGSAPYKAWRRQSGVTHQMNVLECMVRLIRLGVADPWATIDRLGLGLVPAHRSDLEAAAIMKGSPMGRRRNLSLVDALGYAVAQRLQYRFLTGDKGFRGLPSVEFVAE